MKTSPLKPATNKRKICVISATRAEWYLLSRLCKQIQADENLELQLILTGAHLSENQGFTYKAIEQEFQIAKKIQILLANDDKIALCKAMGLGFISLSEALAELKPDIALILGDRYEMLAVASTCLLMHIPLAHLCGGELTLGAFDDSIRHAITKMAHLHFVSTALYKKRVEQLGEEPSKVFNVGSLAGELILNLKLLSKKELEKELDFHFDENIYLITYHPTTLKLENLEKELKILLGFLDTLKNASLIFTKANADEMGLFINKNLELYCEKNAHKARLFDNLGSQKYLSLMKIAKAVVGNSSSGISETVFFKSPCINIGDRQKGRLRTANIIDTPMCELKKAFKMLESEIFKAKLKNLKNPYKNKNASKIIKEVLKKVDLSTILQKKFIDLK
ncbi:UDP-N-acetylglucosamine 2-epimerase [Campylobacter sp. MIT 97-5078]|uniref:UDP-N-acetylglucosamine 2-epimerase n=1 Tax=Campylobacter sp. MIT 97-5078 TaxID=1548153 RepID=UPI000513BC61|nr:UDP-N-acetylglucosamine 2-epimerase [Campylobacter sp. MIT 97-5078]KGI55415.1 UDP-N-acetylglucosamine 2-epimerase [Campylobacter sp. MIT 97-5078]TQR27650.1 UDP-N-acetylglucosamine 2-epimerase (hydrolyzing) [Campylobacter sp. MIT 97-5078]